MFQKTQQEGASACGCQHGDQAGIESLDTVSTMLGFFPGTLQIYTYIYIYVPVNKTSSSSLTLQKLVTCKLLQLFCPTGWFGLGVFTVTYFHVVSLVWWSSCLPDTCLFDLGSHILIWRVGSR